MLASERQSLKHCIELISTELGIVIDSIDVQLKHSEPSVTMLGGIIISLNPRHPLKKREGMMSNDDF